MSIVSFLVAEQPWRQSPESYQVAAMKDDLLVVINEEIHFLIVETDCAYLLRSKYDSQLDCKYQSTCAMNWKTNG